MTPEKPFQVFLSCGTTYTGQQEAFVKALEANLQSRDCEHFTVGRNYHSLDQPVKAARDLIGKCDGMIVVAFERTRVHAATEKPDSPKAKAISEERHPTVWNQIEAAMGYGQDLPLLIFAQTGLRRQAMLSDRTEWFAQETDLTIDFIQSDRFRQVSKQWMERMKQRRAVSLSTAVDLSKRTIGDFMRLLTPGQLWGILGAVVSLVSAVAAIAYKLGGIFHKP